MTGVALILTCLAIVAQFNVILSENNSTSHEVDIIHRTRRNHEALEDEHYSSTDTTKKSKTYVDKSKTHVSNKKRDKPEFKSKPIAKNNITKTDSNIINIRKADKPKTLKIPLHFIEDVDNDPRHIHVKEFESDETPVKDDNKEVASKDIKAKKEEEIGKVNTKAPPSNKTKDSTKVLLAQSPRAGSVNDSKHAVASSKLESYGAETKTKTVKEKTNEESVNVYKYHDDDLDSCNAPDGSVIEIKENKYEEEIVRFYPAHSCYPDRRYWEPSQFFNPTHNSYCTQSTPYQRYTQAYPYQRTSNKDNYCHGYYDLYNQNSGQYFNTNFDNPYRVQENRFQRFSCGNGFKKTWTNRNTRFTKPVRPDKHTECTEEYFVCDK